MQLSDWDKRVSHLWEVVLRMIANGSREGYAGNFQASVRELVDAEVSRAEIRLIDSIKERAMSEQPK